MEFCILNQPNYFHHKLIQTVHHLKCPSYGSPHMEILFTHIKVQLKKKKKAFFTIWCHFFTI